MMRGRKDYGRGEVNYALGEETRETKRTVRREKGGEKKSASQNKAFMRKEREKVATYSLFYFPHLGGLKEEWKRGKKGGKKKGRGGLHSWEVIR